MAACVAHGSSGDAKHRPERRTGQRKSAAGSAPPHHEDFHAAGFSSAATIPQAGTAVLGLALWRWE
jgi:hypothetical protein